MSAVAKVPKLRFPGFGGVWKQKKVGDISSQVIAGGTPSTLKKEYWDGTIRWMSSGELNYKKVYEVEKRITEAGLKNSSTKLIPVGCILIGLAGQGKTRGTVAINMVELCTNQSIAAIFPNEQIFDNNFLYQNLDSRYDELRRLSTGEGGRGGLNLQIIKSLKVPLPPKAEQQKIASFLTAVDGKIEQLTKKQQLLEQYKKGVMQKLFSREIRFRAEDGSEFPEWEERKLGDIATFLDSKRIPLSEDERASKKGKYPYFGASGVIDHINDYIFDGEYVLLAEDGANIITRSSRLAFVVNGRFWVNNHAHILQAFESNAFLAEALERLNFTKYNTGTAQPKLNAAICKKIKLYVPSNCEQTEIADFLSSIDTKIDLVTKELENAKRFKKGLLQQMFV
jgi:type I restriction enzyme S subunit